MKVLLPVDETKNAICESFGRAPFFGLVDTETGKMELLDNPAASAEGGAGIKAAQFVADKAPDALLTPRAGSNANDVLKETNIKIFKTTGTSIEEAVEAFKADKLEPITEFHKGFMH